MRKLASVPPLVFYLLLLHSQNRQVQPSQNTSFLGGFNQEAASTDVSGIRKYSEDLVGLIVPEGVSKDDIRSLSERLAQSELRARDGKGKLVPESDIARSFDVLMHGIGAPPAWKADVQQIRKFRARSVTEPDLSALFTAGRNGTNCNPGEAVLLLYLLILNRGQLIETSSDFANPPSGRPQSSALNRRAGDPNHDCLDLISSYCATHSRREVRRLLDHVAQTLNF